MPKAHIIITLLVATGRLPSTEPSLALTLALDDSLLFAEVPPPPVLIGLHWTPSSFSSIAMLSSLASPPVLCQTVGEHLPIALIGPTRPFSPAAHNLEPHLQRDVLFPQRLALLFQAPL